MRLEDLRSTVRSAPDHRPGFWEDLGLELDRTPVWRRPSQPGWLVAVEVAAAVILVTAVGTWLFDRAPGGGPVIAPPPVTVTTEAEPPDPDRSLDGVAPDEPAATTSSTDAPPDTIAATQSVVDVSVTSPWARDPISQSETGSILPAAWSAAENTLWCSALHPTGAIPPGAVERTADFSGGWALAWDLPELRSAFGVAGTGLWAFDDIAVRWPNLIRYQDGGVIGFGREGFDEESDNLLAEFEIPGQGCAYQVWSRLGEEHLQQLVDSLRLVDGLEAEPVEADREIRDLGAAPWSAEVPAVPSQYPAPDDLPTPVLTAGVPSDAVLRLADVGDWGVAWDAPSGPGHDSLNYACADCGRGVVGLYVSRGSFQPEGRIRLEWDDGSSAEIRVYVGDVNVPLDRARITDQTTGELLSPGLQADILLPGGDASVSIWSHLGLDHLLELIEGLRIIP